MCVTSVINFILSFLRGMGKSSAKQLEEAEVYSAVQPEIKDIAKPQRLKTSDGFGDVWKISVPREKDILWQIAFSFLFQGEPKLGDQEWFHVTQSALKDIKSELNKFNPFEKNYSCFSHDGLNSIISCFQELLTSNAGVAESTNGSANDLHHAENVTGDLIVQEASKILRCEIKIYSQRNGDCFINHVLTYRPQLESVNEDICIIIVDENLDLQGRRFSFCLKDQIAVQLRLNAFENIFNLFSGKEEDAVRAVYNLPDAKTDLLIGLLKNHLQDVARGHTSRHVDIVRELYDQPPYIFERLSYAGFVTDPMKPESAGNNSQSKTAFYYATLTGDFELLYQLYDYAACAPNWARTFNRIPSDALLQNYEKLTSVILSAEKQLESETFSPDDKETYLCHIKQIYSIHKFQRELYEHLRQIFDRRQNGSDPKEIAEMRRDILLAVMDAYGSYFNGPDLSEGQSWTNYDLYQKYSNYFYYVDIFGALKFFDHSFALKDALRIEGDLYEEMESAFCRLVFFYWKLDEEVESTKNDEYKLILTYLNRKHFESELKELQKRLSAAEGTFTNCLPKKEIDVLKSIPEINDEFIFSRLKRHLSLVQELDTETKECNDIKVKIKLLVILRSVHVLGESLKIVSEASVTLMNSLLVSNFSLELNKRLRKIRDCLSHSNKKLLWARWNIENEDIFQGVRNELKELESELNHIEEIQIFRIHKWFLSRKLDLVRNNKVENLELGNKTYLPNLDNAAYEFEKEIRMLKSDFVEYSQQSREKYEKHFKNLAIEITNYSSEKVKSTEPEKLIEIINARLDCYKQILHFLLAEFSNIPVQEEYKKLLDELERGVFCLSEPKPFKFLSREAKNKLNRLIELKDKAFEVMGFPKSNTCEAIKVEKAEHSRDNIEKLYLLLKGCSYIPKEEKEKNCSYFETQHRTLSDAEFNLAASSEGTKQVANENLKTEVPNLGDTATEHSEVIIHSDAPEKGMEEPKEQEDPRVEILTAIDGDHQLDKGKWQGMSEGLNLSEEPKSLPMEQVKNEKKIENTALQFLKNRVVLLKETIVQYLTSDSSKETVLAELFDQHKLLLSFPVEKGMPSEIELLVFDCWNVLRSKESTLSPQMKRLWIKTNCLFSGIDLRNVFGHGNPLLEAIGSCLDPWDLSNEIVQKVAEIISDCEAIEAICYLHDQTRADREKLVDIIESDETDKDLCQKIRSCKRWKDYCLLVPKANTRS